jgi:hypothetical protein
VNHGRALSLGDRWRRQTNRAVDDKRISGALSTLSTIRPRVRLQAGSLAAEFLGAMGSIHEVSIHVPKLPPRIWDHVARVLRRSTKMLEALEAGRVPRSFDRLVARIGGESVLPEARRIKTACTCGSPETPCRHVLALHELFAQRLDERPWELLVLRGVDFRDVIDRARSPAGGDVGILAFGTTEEPILFPEGADGDLDRVLEPGQTASLLGLRTAGAAGGVEAALGALAAAPASNADGKSIG